MRISIIVSLSALFLICNVAQAQWSTVQPRLNVGLYLGSPIDDYAKTTNSTGAGVNVGLAIPFGKQVPFYGGFEFGYMLFGSNTQNETLTASITANGTEISQMQIPLRVKTTNNVYFWHLSLRAQLPTPIIQPYVQGLVGFRYMTTNTKIFDDSDDQVWSDADNGLIVQQKQLSDYVGSYGAGVGLMIPLGKSIMIDARADYMYGGKARYYDGEDVDSWEVEFIGDPSMIDEIDGDVVSFSAEPRESYTNMYTFTLGVSFLLGGGRE